MPKHYDWVIEELDEETGEITDVRHEDTYPGPQPGCHVGLVCDDVDKYGDLKDRYWAYIDDQDNGDWLPRLMESASGKTIRTPAKYLTEVLTHNREFWKKKKVPNA